MVGTDIPQFPTVTPRFSCLHDVPIMDIILVRRIGIEPIFCRPIQGTRREWRSQIRRGVSGIAYVDSADLLQSTPTMGCRPLSLSG